MRTRNVSYDPGANFEHLFPDAVNGLNAAPSAPLLRAMVRAATACAKRASASRPPRWLWDRSTPARVLQCIADLGAKHAFLAAAAEAATDAGALQVRVDVAHSPPGEGPTTTTVSWLGGMTPKQAENRLLVSKILFPECVRLFRIPDPTEVHAVVQRLDPAVAASAIGHDVWKLCNLPLLRGRTVRDVANEYRDVTGAGVEAGDPAPLTLSVEDCEVWCCSPSPLARQIAFSQLAKSWQPSRLPRQPFAAENRLELGAVVRNQVLP